MVGEYIFFEDSLCRVDFFIDIGTLNLIVPSRQLLCPIFSHLKRCIKCSSAADYILTEVKCIQLKLKKG